VPGAGREELDPSPLLLFFFFLSTAETVEGAINGD
jgi:hypothetical protein